jgi:hypothetical protein
MSDDTPLAESEIETDRLPWCIVVPIKDKDTGQEYSDPDIVGPFATCAEAELWLESYYNQLGGMYGRGELRCMISPALERAVRRESEEFYQKKFGACVSLKKPPGAS